MLTYEFAMGLGGVGKGGCCGKATVGGSGCDLDTVRHTAFLIGHFDHWLLPATNTNALQTCRQTLFSSFNDGKLLHNGCEGAMTGTAFWNTRQSTVFEPIAEQREHINDYVSLPWLWGTQERYFSQCDSDALGQLWGRGRGLVEWQ